MAKQINKTTLTLLLSAFLSLGMGQVHANIQDQLPDIGTAASMALSINQELAMGDFYVRQLRASTPLINDPLLTKYINELGNKLVAHASSVHTPFHFYLIRNNQINAYAFFGGNVVLHSGLFRDTQNESELASVLAHEISHITQRHLARAMEEQQKNAPLTWIGTLGSILLAMASPQAGMAALSTTLASSQQGIISFTQLNEQEADRVGIRVLQRAGFNPQAMPDFLQTLADQSRYTSKPPEMLLTHPLPDSRLADARNRAGQVTTDHVPSSQDYWFAKVRILGMYSSENTYLNKNLLDLYRQGNTGQQLAAKYGEAISLYQEKKYADAGNILLSLLPQNQNNIWFLDLITDIDLEQNKTQQAITRLQKAMITQRNEPVLQLNLANAYIKGGQPTQASQLLYRYTFNNPDDPNGWDLLAQATAVLGLRDEELAARAENLALSGQLPEAISLLSNASSLVKLGSLKQARYDARIDQLRLLTQRYRQYQRS